MKVHTSSCSVIASRAGEAKSTERLRGGGVQIFLGLCAGVFLLTAAAKLASDFADPRLAQPDPLVWFLSSRQLLILVALLEIGVGS